MTRTLLLAALFLLLGGTAWYITQRNKTRTGTANNPDMEFAVKNTDDIHKIFIADRKGRTATIERKDGFWLYNGQYKARPTAVKTLLETMNKVNVAYIAPKAAEPQMVKSLASEGIKVEIYDKSNKKIKSYYVGGVTSDEHGTYMIMEGSEQPYVTHIPTFVGQLRVRYLLGDDNWRDRSVFDEKADDIQAISVEYPKEKSESFRMEKKGDAEYTVKPLFGTTPVIRTPQRKGIAEAYILQYESKIAEAFETSNPRRDSVSNLQPFVIITVEHKNGEAKKVRFWPVAIETHPEEGYTFVERYFTDINGTSFMLTQHRVMGTLFRGYSFFFEGQKAPMKN